MQSSTETRAPEVAVAILTKNGGKRARQLFEALGHQDAPFPFEIVVVDSGSTDGTDKWLEDRGGIRLERIAAAQFQHGRTRNLAMRLSSAPLVAFITQDAVPADPGWLRAWVDFMARHPEVAGAFGHQVPHEDADPLEAYEVSNHFNSFRGGPEVFRREGPAAGGDMQRARSHFFSNVNSCIRRRAWEQFPFPEVDFGEDQAWADAVLSRGLALGHCMAATVRHSHDYGPLTLFRRRYDEARFLRQLFGYSFIPTLKVAAAVARNNAADFRRHVAASGSPARPAARAWASALGLWAGAKFAHHEGLGHRFVSLHQHRWRA
jgi:rhamnosyltransferase